MALFDASGSSLGIDISKEFFLGNFSVGDITGAPIATATQFAEIYQFGLRTDYIGSFANYTVDQEFGTQVPMVALINSMNVSLNGNTLFSLSGISHYPLNYRGQSNETKNLAMLSGDDQITGSNLADVLGGGSGNDVIDGRAGNDTINGHDGIDIAKYSLAKSNYVVQKVGNTFTVTGGNEGSDTLINVERLQFADVTLDINQAIGGSSPASTTTAGYLQQKFNLSIADARTWVMANLDKPRDIYDICHNNGVTSSMLADIVQANFPPITITGAVVNDWLNGQGVPSLA